MIPTTKEGLAGYCEGIKDGFQMALTGFVAGFALGYGVPQPNKDKKKMPNMDGYKPIKDVSK